MASDLILYTNPQSRGRIARWMLEEVGADYETVVLDYGTSMKGAEYLAVNPMGKVPTIVHNGTVVTECAAVCAYLADAFPDAGLVPTSLADKAAYHRWMFFAAGPLEAAVADRMLGVEVPAEKRGMVGYGSYDTAVDTLEAAIAGRQYIAGDRFSAADVYVGSHIMWGTMFGTLPKRQAFLDYIGPLAERPAHVRATELDDALVPAPVEG